MPVEKRNIFLHETRDTLPFVSKRRRSGTTFPAPILVRTLLLLHMNLMSADAKI